MAVVSDAPRPAFSLRNRSAGLRKRSEATWRDRLLLLLVWVIVLGLIGGPIVYLVVGAFSVNATDPTAGLTLSTIKTAYSWSTIWLLIRSLGFSLMIGVLATAIATCWAWSTVRLQMRAARVREVLALLPLFVPPLVSAIAWIWLATPNSGLLDVEFRDLGFLSWLQPNVMSTPGMAFVMVAQFVPLGYLFVSGAMRRVDGRMEEASLLCGRGMTYTSFRITLRILRPSLLSAVMFLTVLVIGQFAIPELLGQDGAFAPLAVTIYNALFGTTENFPLAAGVSTQMIIVCLVGLYLYRRAVRSSERFVSVGGRGHQERRIPVSWPLAAVVWALTLVYVVITFVLPFAAVIVMAMSQYLAPTLSDVHLSWHAFWSTVNTPDVWSALRNTAVLAVTVPIVAVSLGTIIVYLTERVNARTSRALTYLATTPLAVPGLVLGTGLFFLYIRTPLFGSLVLIGLGLVAATLTHAVRVVGNGIQQVDRSLEEASQLCGVSRQRTLWKVVVPLLRPAIFSSFVLVFALSSLDLTVPLPLQAPGTSVIPIVLWDNSQQVINQAAAIGVLQLAFLVVGVVFWQFVFRIRRKGI